MSILALFSLEIEARTRGDRGGDGSPHFGLMGFPTDIQRIEVFRTVDQAFDWPTSHGTSEIYHYRPDIVHCRQSQVV